MRPWRSKPRRHITRVGPTHKYQSQATSEVHEEEQEAGPSLDDAMFDSPVTDEDILNAAADSDEEREDH